MFHLLGLVIGDPEEAKKIELSNAVEKMSDTESNPFKYAVKNVKYIKIISKRLVEFEKKGFISLNEVT